MQQRHIAVPPWVESLLIGSLISLLWVPWVLIQSNTLDRKAAPDPVESRSQVNRATIYRQSP